MAVTGRLMWMGTTLAALLGTTSIRAQQVELPAPVSGSGEGSGIAVPGSPEIGATEDLADINLDELMRQAEQATSEGSQVVTTASKHGEARLRAPATMTVLDADQIRASGATTIPELLQRVPGIQVFRNGPGNYVVSLRGSGGLTGNNVVVLVDSVPINSMVDGTVDWSTVPVQMGDLDRIEVVRGPVSTLYGANAYTGVINLVPRKPTDESWRTYGLASGTLDGRLRAGTTLAVSTSSTRGANRWRLSVFGLRDRTRSRANPKLDTPDIDEQPAWVGTGARAAWEYLASEHLVVSVQLAGAASRRSSLGDLVLASESCSRAEGYGVVRARLMQPVEWLNSAELWARTRALGTHPSEEGEAGFSFDGTRATSAQYGFDVDVPVLVPLVSLRAGADSTLRRVDAPYMHPDHNGQFTWNHGAYAMLHADLADAVVFSGGLRGDTSPISGKVQPSFRGSIILYQLYWSARLTAATAFREPTFVEAGGRFVDPQSRLILLEGNADLKPPANDSVEGAVMWSQGPLALSSAIYVANLRNLVLNDFAPLTRKSFKNDPTIQRVLGVELEGSFRLTRQVLLRGGASRVHWMESSSLAESTVGVPGHNSGVTGWFSLESHWIDDRLVTGLNASIASGRTYNIRTGIPPVLIERDVPWSTVMDASLGFRPFTALPVWLYVKGRAAAPYHVVESPLPGAAEDVPAVTFAMEHRDG